MKIQETRDADGTRKVTREVDGLLDGRTIVYQPNGVIGALFYFRGGRLHGKQYRFYPSGKPMLLENAQDGQLEGKSYKFYESGRIAMIRQMVRGKRSGRYLEFYDSANKKPKLYSQLVVVDGKEHTNGYILYDSLGRVQDRWGFLQVSAAQDTIRLGQTLALRLQVRFPKEAYVLANVYGYDSLYRLVAPQEKVTVLGDNHVVMLTIQPPGRGRAEVRGYVADYKAAQELQENQRNTTVTDERRIYFTYPYYVR
ncbi:hypothetical protein LGH70_07440 [Hymenobacter sp. BT635]|uniref:Toxin-antitoxin system YwqK family antitoxin n=1 Tax=Hymenobacter nitidus TaxID=2880929 RepID=A0ABS8AAJ6_9BACT|nr:hypothetical protein [Hymenobacter nitidus]MCB2377408.1 hypothetical protein [Hymenobacter nitidus]